MKARALRIGLVAFVRLVPVFPFNLLNYALGLTHISVRTFAVTSFVTMVPGALAYAYLGYTTREAVSGRPDLVSKACWAVTLLAAVALLPSLLRRWRRVKRPAPHQTFVPPEQESAVGSRSLKSGESAQRHTLPT